LDIGDERLDLYDEQGPRCRVKCQDIDASALPVPAERHLDAHSPTGRLELAGEQCLERGMSGIQKPIQLSAAPSAVHVKVDIERFANASQCVNGEARWPLPLEL